MSVGVNNDGLSAALVSPGRTLDDVYAAIAQLRGELAALREMLAPIALYAPRPVPVHRPAVVLHAAAGDDAPSGATLRERRWALELSQRALADAASVARSTVAEVERGTRRNTATRAHLASVLDYLAKERQPA